MRQNQTFIKYLTLILLGALLVCGSLFAQKSARRTPAPRNKDSEALIDAGDKLADDRKWNEAIDAYQQATRVDPQNADAYVGLGDAYMGAGKWTEALVAYKKAVALDPQSADAQYALGDAYNTMRMHGDAFAPLVKAIQLDPNFAEAYYGIGYAYLNGQQYSKSLSFFNSAIRLKADYEDAHYGLAVAYLNLGNQKGLDDERKKLIGLNSALVKKLDTDIVKFNAAAKEVLASSGAAQSSAGAPQTSEPTKQKTPLSAASAEQKTTAPNDPVAFERVLWESIKNSKDPEDFKYYLRKYPNGEFADVARIKSEQGNPKALTITTPATAAGAQHQTPSFQIGDQGPQTVRPRTVSQQKPELYVQRGHSERVQALAFSPDGKMLASGSDDLTIKFWEVATGKELKTLVGHMANVIFLTFSPDGKTLASTAKGEESIRLWDVRTGNALRSIAGITGDVYQLQFSPDGKALVSGSYDGVIKMWNLATGKELRTFQTAEEGSSIRSLALSADGQLLASGDVLGFVEVWVVSTGKKLRTLQGIDANPVSLKMREYLNLVNTKFMNSVDAVVFDREGKTLTTVAANAIRRFEVTSGKVLSEISRDNKYGIRQAAANPSGRSVAYAERGHADSGYLPVKVLDITSGKALSTFMIEEEVESVALSADGHTLACGGFHVGSIALVDAGTGKQIRALSHTLSISEFAVSDAGNLIAVEREGSIQLWNTSLGDAKPLTDRDSDSATDGELVSLAFSKDGKTLAAATSKRTIRLWDVESAKLIATLRAPTTESVLDLVAFDLDNKTLVSVESHLKSNVVRYWDFVSGKELKSVTFEASRSESVISPDTKVLAAIDDHDVKLWSLQTGKQLQVLTGHSTDVIQVAFSADSKTIATVSKDGTKVWEVDTGSEVRTFTGLNIGFVAFSPDGKLLTTDSLGKAMHVLDVRSGNELGKISLNNDFVIPLTLSADGATLVGLSILGKIELWDVKSGNTLAKFVALDENDWVVFTPDGRFDGSADGIKLLHYVQDNKSIPLDSFFEQFYTPKLLQRVLAREAVPGTTAVDFSKPIKLPPLLRITSPKPGAIADTDVSQIVVEATDQGGGVEDIRLYQNGKLVSEDTRQLSRETTAKTRTFDVTLLPGINTFRATAFNSDRTEATPDEIKIELKAVEALSDLYILAIGLNEYKNTRYSLNYGRADAQAFADAVEQHGHGIFKQINKQVIVDDQATRKGIEEAFNKIVAQAKPQDAFVFYFAGHGVMSEGSETAPAEFFLVPYDVLRLYGDDGALATNGVAARLLKDLCTKVRAQKQLIVLDACQSAGALETFARRGAAEEKAMLQLARSAGVVVIAATGQEQVASEFVKLGHGVFTYALLQALSGDADGGNPPDGKITATEIVAYINDRVPELTKQFRGKTQYPNAWARGQDFPVAIK